MRTNSNIVRYRIATASFTHRKISRFFFVSSPHRQSYLLFLGSYRFRPIYRNTIQLVVTYSRFLIKYKKKLFKEYTPSTMFLRLTIISIALLTCNKRMLGEVRIIIFSYLLSRCNLSNYRFSSPLVTDKSRLGRRFRAKFNQNEFRKELDAVVSRRIIRRSFLRHRRDARISHVAVA